VIRSITGIRWISLIALGLALCACSAPSFTAPSREFSGVLLYQFEGSTFVEGETGIPADRPPYDESDWLDWVDWPALDQLMKENMARMSPPGEDCHPVQPFLVTFVGRRTHYPFGGGGHWGLWNSEVMVQRPISAKRLGPPFCQDRYRGHSVGPPEKPAS
jgi:hypothetical protein